MASPKKTTKPTEKKKIFQPAELLLGLLSAPTPSGYENAGQAVLDATVQPWVDGYHCDAMGNRMAVLHEKGSPTLMLAGHLDEIGFIVHYIDEQGFIYFQPVGGHDASVIPGRRVWVLSQKGLVKGVTGKRAIHHMKEEERKKVLEIHKIWIDIGAQSREEALQRVALGDYVIYDEGFEIIHENIVTARAFDDRVGCYVVFETLKRLKQDAKKLRACVVGVANTQEEIGTRGAIVTSYAVKPQVAIAIDVGHATDSPEYSKSEHGDYKLGAGPILTKGPNISPRVFERLVACAKVQKIPYQVEGEGRPTGTDAREIQVSRKGVATGLVSIPLRYMHTPCEVINLQDVEHTIELLRAFALSLTPKDTFEW